MATDVGDLGASFLLGLFSGESRRVTLVSGDVEVDFNVVSGDIDEYNKTGDAIRTINVMLVSTGAARKASYERIMLGPPRDECEPGCMGQM